MNEEKDITSEFWEHIESRRHTKLGEKIYQWLNRDNLDSLIENDRAWYYFLSSPSTNEIPKYVYTYINKWCNKRGLTYVFDLKSEKF